MPDRKNSWPQVALALGLTAILGTCATVVLALGKSETAILTLGALIAAPALAWFATNTSQKLDQVKDLSNGSMNRKDDAADAAVAEMVMLNRQLLALVAQTHPSIPAEVAEKLMPVPIPVSPPAAPPAAQVHSYDDSPTLLLR